MDIRGGRLDDARKALARIPESPSKHAMMGRLDEVQGDVASAENLYRLAHAGDVDFGMELAGFFIRQNRTNECEDLLKTHKDEGQGVSAAVNLALLHWTIRKDADKASGLLVDVPSSESAGSYALAAVACLELARGKLDSCAKIIATLESRPKEDWTNEVCVEFIILVHQLLSDGQGERPLQRLRVLFALQDPNVPSAFRMLAHLAESVNSRLPKTHRKFIVALAEAYYDPAYRNALQVYTQWRAADAPA